MSSVIDIHPHHAAMKLVNVLVTATILVFAQANSRVWAQEAGNATEGLATAEAFCSQCHAVRKSESPSPNSQSPTFVAIANSPGITAAALQAALTTPHAGMPMFILTSQQRANIIIYILGLKQQ